MCDNDDEESSKKKSLSVVDEENGILVPLPNTAQLCTRRTFPPGCAVVHTQPPTPPDQTSKSKGPEMSHGVVDSAYIHIVTKNFVYKMKERGGAGDGDDSPNSKFHSEAHRSGSIFPKRKTPLLLRYCQSIKILAVNRFTAYKRSRAKGFVTSSRLNLFTTEISHLLRMINPNKNLQLQSLQLHQIRRKQIAYPLFRATVN